MTDGRSPVGMTSLGPEATAVWRGDGQALALATARAAPGAAIRPPGTALSLPLLTLQGHRNAVTLGSGPRRESGNSCYVGRKNERASGAEPRALSSVRVCGRSFAVLRILVLFFSILQWCLLFFDFCACSLKYSISWHPAREPSSHSKGHTMLPFAERSPRVVSAGARRSELHLAFSVTARPGRAASGLECSRSVAWRALCESVNRGLRRGRFLPELLPAGLGLSLCTESLGAPHKGLSPLTISAFCQESGFASAWQLHGTAQQSQRAEGFSCVLYNFQILKGVLIPVCFYFSMV